MNEPFSHIRPLKLFNPDFVQVLLTRFVLRHHRNGTRLDVSFDENSPTVASVQGKEALRESMKEAWARSGDYGERIEAVISGSRRELRFTDHQFPFRYVSGGTLPILRLAEEEFYVLFLRDIFPIGWNIANGGSESLLELLQPWRIIDREFREELIIASPENGRVYSFPHFPGTSDEGISEKARQIWGGKSRMWRHEPLDLPIFWIDGPDSVCVRYQGGDAECSDGYFLNINAEDFGIEVDRIARIRLDEDVAMFDGELQGRSGKLVNRVIGLFRTDKVHRLITSKRWRALKPDRFFFNGEGYKGADFDRVVENYFLPHLRGFREDRQILALKSVRGDTTSAP